VKKSKTSAKEIHLRCGQFNTTKIPKLIFQKKKLNTGQLTSFFSE